MTFNIDRLLIICAGLFFLLAASMALLIALEPARLAKAQAARHGETIELGGQLYEEHCRSCHGPRGEGVGQLGPPLADSHFFTRRLADVGWPASLRDYIVASIEHGRLMGTRPIYAGNGSTAVMPAWLDSYGGPLRADQIPLLADFVENWRETALGQVTLAEIEIPVTRHGDLQTIARGEAVFRRSCMQCHAARDTDLPSIEGPDLRSIKARTLPANGPESLEEFIHDSILVPEIEILDEYRQHAQKHPCGAILTVSELNDVTAFLLK